MKKKKIKYELIRGFMKSAEASSGKPADGEQLVIGQHQTVDNIIMQILMEEPKQKHVVYLLHTISSGENEQ